MSEGRTSEWTKTSDFGRGARLWQPLNLSEDAKTVSVDLEKDERTMLVYGLMDWGGPAYGTNSLAVAMGFSDLEDLQEDGDRIARAIAAGHPLSVRDWTRALVAAEFAFASEVLGTGGEWTTIQGGSDEHWINVLRKLQHRVPKARRFLGP